MKQPSHLFTFVLFALSLGQVSAARADQVVAFLDRHPTAAVVGVCFQQMFDKMGWCDRLPFDLLIDATIDPVVVWSD